MSDRYSHSKLGVFRNCPRRFKFQYIERPQVDRPVSADLFTGQMLHRALENLYDLAATGCLLSEEEFLERYDNSWETVSHANLVVYDLAQSVEHYIKLGRDSLQKYYRSHAPFDDGVTLGVEKRLTFTLDEERGYKIVAIIDRLRRRDDGVVEIIDYKFSKGIPSQKDLERNPQMALYQMAVQESWPQYENIVVKQIFLRQGEEFSAKLSPDLLDEARYQAVQDILEIKRALSENEFPTKESPLCKRCPYFSLCPAKRHRLALDDETTAEEELLDAQKKAERYLQLSTESRTIKAELDALKEELLFVAAKENLRTIEGEQGRIKIGSAQKGFPSKSRDLQKFLKISELVRKSEMADVFLDLNEKAAYKDGFLTEKFPQETLDAMRECIIETRKPSLSVSYNKKGAAGTQAPDGSEKD
ncbi:MAG: PD-(D/E)XK nuclease family protein [candidate division Zixibacteria bacterium]|nr:PD-(D/E)XK nuclease family protein [candidate division Zixibacteria bacterium]